MPATSGSGTNFDFSRAEALTKYVYAGKEEALAPESDKLAKDFPFQSGAQKLGRKYYMPVEPNRSMGATFNSDGSAFTLNTSRAPIELTAEVQGCEVLIRQSMSYAMMTRALEGGEGKAGVRAFVSATNHTFKGLSKAGSYFRELSIAYGGGSTAAANLGAVAGVTSAVTTTLVITVAAADWATAIWAGSENGAFDIYSTGGTKRNSAGSGETTMFKLTAVNSSTYTLTFTSDATNVAAVQATDQIFFEGQRTKDCVGLVAAAGLTTLWGVSTTDYNLWKPQSVSVGGQATFESIMEGAVKVADIGFSGKMRIHMNPATFKDVNDDQVALVSHASKSSGKVTVGFDSITYQGPTGTFEMVPNIYIKRGIAFGIPSGECQRIGSTDLTYTLPGYGKMLRELDGTAGVEARIYSDQAPFITNPGHFVYYSGIVNSTD